MTCTIALAGLTSTDVSIVREAASKLMSRGLVGRMQDVVDERGARALAMIHPRNGRTMFAVCRRGGRYRIVGEEGEPLAEGRTLDDVLEAACSRRQHAALRRFAEAAATVPL